MATNDEISHAIGEAQLHILQAIKTNAGNNRASAQTVNSLAEAFAWLTSPSQPHGGSDSGS